MEDFVVEDCKLDDAHLYTYLPSFLLVVPWVLLRRLATQRHRLGSVGSQASVVRSSRKVARGGWLFVPGILDPSSGT